MKQYLISIFQPNFGEGQPPRETLDEIMKDVRAVREDMQRQGAWVFSGGLFPPSTATTIRVQNGAALTTDGPFAEAKEALGGFTIVQSADFDQVLRWARKLAEATGLPLEVRPFREAAPAS